MYIRNLAHTDNKNRQQYYTFKLVESLRTERGPRQRTLLNLGHAFSQPEENWKDLANRIEEIITGQTPLFDTDPEIEALAIRFCPQDRRRLQEILCSNPHLRHRGFGLSAGGCMLLWIMNRPGLSVQNMLSMRQ